MARPKTRHPEARQFNAWLPPEDWATLDAYQAQKGLSNRTAALQLILEGVRSWLRRGPPSDHTKPARSVRPLPVEEDSCPEMDAAEDTYRPGEEFDEHPDHLA